MATLAWGADYRPAPHLGLSNHPRWALSVQCGLSLRTMGSPFNASLSSKRCWFITRST